MASIRLRRDVVARLGMVNGAAFAREIAGCPVGSGVAENDSR